MPYKAFENLATKDELWMLWFFNLKAQQSTEFELRERFMSRFNALAERVFSKSLTQPPIIRFTKAGDAYRLGKRHPVVD